MAMILSKQKLVLNAFLVLDGSTPGNTAFQSHLGFLADADAADGLAGDGSADYRTELNNLFSSKTSLELADLLMTNLGIPTTLYALSDVAAAIDSAAPTTVGGRVGVLLNVCNALEKGNFTGTDIESTTLAAAKTAYLAKLQGSYEYSVDPANKSSVSLAAAGTYTLTTGQDQFVGGAVDNLFNGFVMQNDHGASANSFSTGDTIDGGAGTDTVYATLINDKKVDSGDDLDINVKTTNVEIAKFEVLDEKVVVDAGNMDSVEEYWSVNSDDAGLRIEDVRLGSKLEITKDITFGMKDVDFESDLVALFDSASFRNAPAVSKNAQIIIEAGYEDAPTGATNANPAQDLYISLSFTHNGKNFASGFIGPSADNTSGNAVADTYAGLRDMLQAELVKQGFPTLTVSLGADINSVVTDAGTKALQLTATQLIVTDPAGTGFTNITSSAAPISPDPTSDVASRVYTVDPTTSTNLIESNLILDNAGRGSTAGDVMIGAMSNSNAGIQKFNVMVDRDSAIESLETTNSKLQQIAITSLAGKGTLEIGSTQAGLTLIDASAFQGSDLQLGTTNEDGRDGTDEENGVNDVVTARVENLKTLSAAIAGDVTFYGDSTEATLTSTNKAYSYTTGSGDDLIDYTLDGNSVDSKGESFAINAGNGSNEVIVEMDDNVTYTTMAGLKNLSITTGSGADEITNIGKGTFAITAGAGSDFVHINTVDMGTAGTTAANAVYEADLTLLSLADGEDLTADGDVIYSNASGGALNAAAVAAAIDGDTVTIGGIDYLIDAADPTAVTFTAVTAAADAIVLGDNIAIDATGLSTDPGDTTADQTVAGVVGVFGTDNADTGEWHISVTDEDNSASLATFVDRVLYKAVVTVNFAGFESQAAVATTSANNFVATQIDINTAIKAAIAASPELSQLLSTKDTTDAKELVIYSTVEGANDLTIDLFQPEAIDSGTASSQEVLLASNDLAALRAGLIKTLDLLDVDDLNPAGGMVSDDSEILSDALEIAAAINDTADIESGTAGFGHLGATGAVAANAYAFLGTASGDDGNDETNVTNFSSINMGSGANDLVVLNSHADSANTLVFTGSFGKVSVVNFFVDEAVSGTGNGVDGIADDTANADNDLEDAVAGLHKLDFKAILADKYDSSTSLGASNNESATRVSTTDSVIAANSLEVTYANEVIIVNDFAQVDEDTETWADLDAAELEDVLNDDTLSFGGLELNSGDAVSDTAADDLLSDTIDTIIFVQNDLNPGEYKVFNVEWSDVDSDLAGDEAGVVTLLGVVDFGEQITATAVFA